MATLVLGLNFCALPRRALAAPTQAPTQNFTALRTEIAPPWVSDPDNRGTWSLLYSCVFTLVLCVWTAIHLNVPSYHESHLSQWLRKSKWVVLAIIAPELGVYTAFEQYIQAKELIHQLAETSAYRTHQSETLLPQNSQDSDPEKAALKPRVFSLTYAYFVVMGGLAVDVSDIDDRLHSVTLTPSGLRLLAERGHFIEISDGDIRDKSKADIFAKCLVILQVSWIALQTISRKATGYPLSPLEIHTLVHAACATIMYILWFQKPLDVQAPTIVSKAGFEDLAALMLMQDPPLSQTWYSHLDPLKGFRPVGNELKLEASFLMFDGSARSRRDEGGPSCGGHPSPSTTPEVEVADKGVSHVVPRTCDSCINLSKSEHQQAGTSEAHSLSSPTTSRPPAGIRCGPPPGVKAIYDLRSGDFIAEGLGLQPLRTGRSNHDSYDSERCCGLWKFLKPCPPKPALPVQISPALKARLPIVQPRTAYWHEINLSLSEKDLKRWKLAGAAFLKEMEIQGVNISNGWYRSFELAKYSGSKDSSKRTINGWTRDKRLLARRRNLNGDLVFPFKMSLTLWLLASLYGGIHLALWNYDFPTPVESLLWRISAATLTSAPVLLLFLVTGTLLVRWLQETFHYYWWVVRGIWRNLDAETVADIMITVVLAAAMLLYTSARIFIVVESFISLRHVPMGVYAGGLGWSKYIPHL